MVSNALEGRQIGFLRPSGQSFRMAQLSFLRRTEIVGIQFRLARWGKPIAARYQTEVPISVFGWSSKARY